MSALELARLQFGVTTVYHFLFVPVSIGLALLVAILQTLHLRTKDPVYGRMVRFWGTLMLISFQDGLEDDAGGGGGAERRRDRQMAADAGALADETPGGRGHPRLGAGKTRRSCGWPGATRWWAPPPRGS